MLLTCKALRDVAQIERQCPTHLTIEDESDCRFVRECRHSRLKSLAITSPGASADSVLEQLCQLKSVKRLSIGSLDGATPDRCNSLFSSLAQMPALRSLSLLGHLNGVTQDAIMQSLSGTEDLRLCSLRFNIIGRAWRSPILSLSGQIHLRSLYFQGAGSLAPYQLTAVLETAPATLRHLHIDLAWGGACPDLNVLIPAKLHGQLVELSVGRAGSRSSKTLSISKLHAFTKLASLDLNRATVNHPEIDQLPPLLSELRLCIDTEGQLETLAGHPHLERVWLVLDSKYARGMAIPKADGSYLEVISEKEEYYKRGPSWLQ